MASLRPARPIRPEIADVFGEGVVGVRQDVRSWRQGEVEVFHRELAIVRIVRWQDSDPAVEEGAVCGRTYADGEGTDRRGTEHDLGGGCGADGVLAFERSLSRVKLPPVSQVTVMVSPVLTTS